MDAAIRSIDDLRREIELLKVVKTEQETAIKSHFSSPVAIFHTVKSFFSGGSSEDKGGGIFGQDLVALASRFVIPFILNKTFFRHSNFIVKALVGLVSQKASGFVTEDGVMSLWDRVKALIPKKKATKKQNIDYGIPPFSESY